MKQDFKGPPPIYVFVTVAPSKRNGLTAPHTGRVGTCAREEDIPAMIAKDLRDMRETFGGLVPPIDTGGRTYRAFRARWTELKI